MSNSIKYYVDDRGRECALFNKMKFIKEESGYYKISNNWDDEIPNSYRLHRAVYEYHYGVIPKRFEIHHKDGNKGNNDITNLEMLSPKEHCNKHMTDERRKQSRKAWDKAREFATLWHKTNPLSPIVHSKASKKGWADRPYYKHNCIQCDKEFETREKVSKFCSGECKNDYNLGYSLLDIESIEYIGKHDVYNMEVEKYHNYAIDGGTIIHNCDSIRYYVNTILKTRMLKRSGLGDRKDAKRKTRIQRD